MTITDTINKPERVTQNRIVKLFSQQLGYDYFGNLEDKPDNRNIETTQLRQYLKDKVTRNK